MRKIYNNYNYKKNLNHSIFSKIKYTYPQNDF